MSDVNRGAEEAKELAERAGSQGKHAARNAGRAVKAVAEPAAEKVGEEVREIGQTVGDKATDAGHAAARAAQSVNPRLLARLTGDTSVGFFALTVSIYAGVIAYNQFRHVAKGGKQVLGG